MARAAELMLSRTQTRGIGRGKLLRAARPDTRLTSNCVCTPILIR